MEPNVRLPSLSRPFQDNPSATIQHYLNWLNRQSTNQMRTYPFSVILEKIEVFDGHPTTRYHIALNKTRLLFYVESELDPVKYPEEKRLFCMGLRNTKVQELIAQWIEIHFDRVSVDFVKLPFKSKKDCVEQKTSLRIFMKYLLKYIERDFDDDQCVQAFNYYNDIENNLEFRENEVQEMKTIALWPFPQSPILHSLLAANQQNQPSTSASISIRNENPRANLPSTSMENVSLPQGSARDASSSSESSQNSRTSSDTEIIDVETEADQPGENFLDIVRGDEVHVGGYVTIPMEYERTQQTSNQFDHIYCKNHQEILIGRLNVGASTSEKDQPACSTNQQACNFADHPGHQSLASLEALVLSISEDSEMQPRGAPIPLQYFKGPQPGFCGSSAIVPKCKCILKSIKCPLCSEEFTSRNGLNVHVRDAHPGQNQKKCPMEGCELTYVEFNELGQHVSHKHKNDRSWPCIQCPADSGVTFTTCKELNAHIRFAHEEGVFMCRIQGCVYEGTKPIEVAIHYDEVHRKIQQIEPADSSQVTQFQPKANQKMIASTSRYLVPSNANLGPADSDSDKSNENLVIVVADMEQSNDNLGPADPDSDKSNDNLVIVEADMEQSNDNLGPADPDSDKSNDNLVIVEADMEQSNDNLGPADPDSDKSNDNLVIVEADMEQSNDNLGPADQDSDKSNDNLVIAESESDQSSANSAIANSDLDQSNAILESASTSHAEIQMAPLDLSLKKSVESSSLS